MNVLIAVLLGLTVAGLSLWIGWKRADRLLPQSVRETTALIKKYDQMKRRDPIGAERLMAEHESRLQAEWEALRNRAQTDTTAASEFYRRAQDDLHEAEAIIEDLRRDARKDPRVGAALANVEHHAAQLRKDVEWARQLQPPHR